VVAAIGTRPARDSDQGGAYLEQMGNCRPCSLIKPEPSPGKASNHGHSSVRRLDEKELLSWAAIAEKRSEHPVGKAVIEKAEERGLIIPHPTLLRISAERGSRFIGTLDHSRGGREMLKREEVEIPDSAQKLQVSQEAEGMTTLFVASDGHLSDFSLSLILSGRSAGGH